MRQELSAVLNWFCWPLLGSSSLTFVSPITLICFQLIEFPPLSALSFSPLLNGTVERWPLILVMAGQLSLLQLYPFFGIIFKDTVKLFKSQKQLHSLTQHNCTSLNSLPLTSHFQEIYLAKFCMHCLKIPRVLSPSQTKIYSCP